MFKYTYQSIACRVVLSLDVELLITEPNYMPGNYDYKLIAQTRNIFVLVTQTTDLSTPV